MSMKVKTILVSQPEPKAEGSPYFELATRQSVKIDFRPFSQVEGLNAANIRKQKIDFKNYSAIIFTSKNAVDHFFKIAEEMRFKVPETMKYFCQSEAVAYYLQKYVIFRKRKVYIGDKTFSDLVKVVKKHKTEKFLVPSSETIKSEIPVLLNEIGIDWERVILYNNISADLSDMKDDMKYDILVFFNPAGIKSLFQNFPEFKQNGTLIATFGPSTFREAQSNGLEVNISAPTPQTPSMTMALEEFIKQTNKA